VAGTHRRYPRSGVEPVGIPSLQGGKDVKVQGGNMVGRLDPKTGEVRVVGSPTPKSNPYGMVVSSEGVPFFVEFGSNKVASLDPDTLVIHEYGLPRVDSHPRRVAITPDDVIWYSDYSRGYLGRLDPKTGKISEWPSPGGPRSRPYAITAVGNVIWYSESNTKPNTVVRFDTKNGEIPNVDHPVWRRRGAKHGVYS
jgi:virginiamycin B lyase